MPKRPALAALVVVLATAASGASAAPGEATAVVKKAQARFEELVRKKAPPETFTAELRTLFDVRDLARRALTDHWDKLKPAERDEIVDLLQKLVEKSYTKALRSRVKYRIEYQGEVAGADGATVRTVIHTEKRKRPVAVSVDYVLARDAKGAWRAFDVVTDDVSMLKNYRSQFNRIIAKEGVRGLVAKMKKKLTEAE